MSGKIRIGIVGMGAAGWAFVPAIRGNPAFELAAIAEADAGMRDAAAAETGAAPHPDLPSMLVRSGLDAVYIATPTELHPEHVALASAAGKHVLTEKPMAIRVEQAHGMVAAAERAGMVLQVGHSHSYDLPIARMGEIVRSGKLGRVRMIHTWNFTDWMARPRRSAELDIEQGGGVTYRQGAHQIDILRLIGGGLVKSVRATTFDWDASRSSIGAHTIFLNFADGAVATAIYNGYGHLLGAELTGGVGEWGEAMRPRAPVQPAAALTPEQELAAKRKRARSAIPASAPHQPHFGLTLVSCERGDIRQSPDGLLVYSREGREEIALPKDQSPRDRVIAEFADAIAGKATTHTGRWGVANLEVCTAAIESSRTGKEVELKYQVPAANQAER
ncbi:MAG: Gfo/Idh/MocA family oxidoreductase [Alphaproteobacteria bacterium]|nr:Gfo/Idh/MocA family oxidoreductase [Alphaproteobacteria bacterium]